MPITRNKSSADKILSCLEYFYNDFFLNLKNFRECYLQTLGLCQHSAWMIYGFKVKKENGFLTCSISISIALSAKIILSPMSYVS